MAANKTIRILREAAGMTRAEASRRSGMHPSTWGQIESGRLLPYDGQLSRMAEVLGYEGPPQGLLDEGPVGCHDD